MKSQAARAALVVICPAYIAIYLFVLFVATATSGPDLVRAPGAWYAALAPILYVTIAAAYAFGTVARRLPRAALMLLHLAVLPTLWWSFLGLGLVLPLIAVLWWVMDRKPAAAAA